MLSCRCCGFQHAVIVAMTTVRMVEVTVHQVVGMVAVRNRLVSAIRPMYMAFLVPSAIVVRGTRCRVFSTYGDLVLVNMITVRVVEVPIVKIVLMAVVLHGRMPAVRTMDVSVCFVYFMIAHFNSP